MAQDFDLGLKRFQVLQPSTGNDEVGAGTREGAPEILARAAAGACHDRNFAGQVEKILGHSFLQGCRITFIRPGSRAYRRLNHSAPSLRGASADMSGSTLIAPVSIRWMHSRYSPA